MRTILTANRQSMGKWVAKQAADCIRQAIKENGSASIVVATGSSQFEVLAALVKQPRIDWSKVEGFHLDEYVGLSDDHPASFCRYLRERFVTQVPLADFHYLRGDQDPQETIEQTGKQIQQRSVDVALVGIGENAHLAFNDPPADFQVTDPYILVQLDQACRQQQVGEGWFDTIDDVPNQAISMSIQQILKAKQIFCSVPDERKANAVQLTLEGPIEPKTPASILRWHHGTTFVSDRAAASQLSRSTLDLMERVK
ncbi:glucosamine-6-phosphate deaminase [Novipirellula artificiosorum]|uniref:Glucosamine-6-phosphate deaminase n=1 Tax=Novipirellula artificiosorum TaxID=2528016 RepID=A0A5C6DYG3_9BACT|nr:glucosamine-6-phosphate deaminase [Novipirellula artificiosorum]TWU40867.1 Glucosamine-6-phosphate deaminase [Novipirellula artificiosorum]